MATYPSCIEDSQLCNFCYASQTCWTCKNRDSHPCEDYCNSGCNTKCDSAQTFCKNGRQIVVSHDDVDDFDDLMPGCWVRGEFIFKNWTAENWNKVLAQLEAAAGLGEAKNQGSIPEQIKVTPDPKNDLHPAYSLVTADAYNSMVNSINFFNNDLATVNRGDVIRAAHALALETGYNSMTFNSNVCDVCNAGGENRNDCNCSDPCTCGCSCNRSG